MFCKNCGAQLEEDAAFCMQCGTPAQDAPAAQPQAAPAKPVREVTFPKSREPVNPAFALKKIQRFIVAGVATLALILAILNLFGLYSAPANGTNATGWSSSISVPLTLVYDNFNAVFLMITNIFYGLTSLVIAGVGVLYFLEKQFKINLYSNFIYRFIGGLLGKLVGGDGVYSLIGAFGVAAGLLQLIGFISVVVGGASVSMPFLSWLMLFVYALLAVADLLWLNRKEK